MTYSPYPTQPQPPKKGLGGLAIAAIATAAVVGGLVLLLIVVALFAGSPEKNTMMAPVTSTPTSEAAAPAQPLVLKGKGTDVTEAVTLQGDFKVTVKWSGNVSRYDNGTNMVVKRIGDGGLFDSLIVNEIAASGSETSVMSGLRGKQVFEVKSQGNWSITIRPLG